MASPENKWKSKSRHTIVTGKAFYMETKSSNPSPSSTASMVVTESLIEKSVFVHFEDPVNQVATATENNYFQADRKSPGITNGSANIITSKRFVH